MEGVTEVRQARLAGRERDTNNLGVRGAQKACRHPRTKRCGAGLSMRARRERVCIERFGEADLAPGDIEVAK